MAITYPELVALTSNEYTTLLDLLQATQGKEKLLSMITYEYQRQQTIGRDLPIKVASGRTEDVGAFLEPWQLNKASELTSIDGGPTFHKLGTYSRRDIMGMRDSAIAIKEREYLLQGAIGNLWRAKQTNDTVMKMGLDVEHDILYGDPKTDPRNMLGLMPRFSVLTDMDGIVKAGDHAGEKSPYITLDAGGTGSGLASVLLVYPNAERGVAWLVPNGDTLFTGGIEYKKGAFQDSIVTDSSNTPRVHRQAVDTFLIVGGVGMMNRQGAIRIANVDVSTTEGLKKFERALFEAMEAVDPDIANGFIAYIPKELNVDLKVAYNGKYTAATYENAKIQGMKTDFSMGGMTFRSCRHMTKNESRIA